MLYIIFGLFVRLFILGDRGKIYNSLPSPSMTAVFALKALIYLVRGKTEHTHRHGAVKDIEFLDIC